MVPFLNKLVQKGKGAAVHFGRKFRMFLHECANGRMGQGFFQSGVYVRFQVFVPKRDHDLAQSFHTDPPGMDWHPSHSYSINNPEAGGEFPKKTPPPWFGGRENRLLAREEVRPFIRTLQAVPARRE
jgi:hypothetical protein